MMPWPTTPRCSACSSWCRGTAAPLRDDNPDCAVRTLPFGRAGLVTYLILDDQRRVDVLNIVWMD